MRIARLVGPDGPTYAIVEGGTAHLLAAAPFTDGQPAATGRQLELEGVALLPPCEPSVVFAVGRNYAAHADEMGFAVPDSPSVFIKAPRTVIPHGGTVVLPPRSVSAQVQHEAELAVVIGREARDIPPDRALEHVVGYTCADDVSARDVQRSDVHITRGKGFDTFCPLGPWIETDPPSADAAIRCRVNGTLRQDGRLSQLLIDVPHLVASISSWTTLRPGDVILTGSPGGTGDLADGDTVEIEVDGVGRLVHHVTAA